MATMAETRTRGASLERYAPLTGVLAVLLWVIGSIVYQTAVDAKNPTTLLDSYRNEEGSILLGGFLWLLGTFFFFWFLGSLRARLAAAEGGVQRLTAIAFGGGLAAGIFGFALPGTDMAAAIADGADLSGPAAVAIRVVGDTFFIGAEMSAAVLLAATGVHALRTRSLPRWLAWVSLVVALVLILLPSGWAGLLFAFPLWVLVVSYLLWSASANTTAAGAPVTTTP
ncbi:hypothetical protein BH18ACT12_BH18ACT12_04320 [soil metagenome]